MLPRKRATHHTLPRVSYPWAHHLELWDLATWLSALSYAGRPLYYYVNDRRPGQILCQNVAEFGGTWLIVRPSGKLVR